MSLSLSKLIYFLSIRSFLYVLLMCTSQILPQSLHLTSQLSQYLIMDSTWYIYYVFCFGFRLCILITYDDIRYNDMLLYNGDLCLVVNDLLAISSLVKLSFYLFSPFALLFLLVFSLSIIWLSLRLLMLYFTCGMFFLTI